MKELWKTAKPTSGLNTRKKILIIREVYLNLFFGNLPIKMSSKYDEKW